jgi:hypothetical protein
VVLFHVATHNDKHSVELPWTSDRSLQKPLSSTNSIRKRQTSMPPAEFESTIPASKRPHAYALTRVATDIVIIHIIVINHAITTTGRFIEGCA